MRIAVPSTGEDRESPLSSTLGRCSFIMIYDSDSKKYSVIPNPGNIIMDGLGIRAVDAIINAGGEIVLTKGIGVKAYSILAKERIPVLLINAVSSVDEAVKHYLKK
jgi:predicted Fe-Mo cluster-binding NifX family protein